MNLWSPVAFLKLLSPGKEKEEADGMASLTVISKEIFFSGFHMPVCELALSSAGFCKFSHVFFFFHVLFCCVGQRRVAWPLGGPSCETVFNSLSLALWGMNKNEVHHSSNRLNFFS